MPYAEHVVMDEKGGEKKIRKKLLLNSFQRNISHTTTNTLNFRWSRVAGPVCAKNFPVMLHITVVIVALVFHSGYAITFHPSFSRLLGLRML